MSDTSGGLGWWQAGDDKWYPPERHPDPEWRARYPAAAPPPAPVGAGGGKGRPRWLVPVAVIAVIAIVVATAAYLLGSAQDGDGTATDTTGQAITLEAASNPGPNPFTTDLTVNEIAAQPDAIDAVTAIQADLPTDDLTGTLIATGTTPGLYGGTTNDQACDPTQLAEFLTDPANTDKATAWAQAQNIPVDNIDTFITNLTPVTLTTDTWVTNNGYKNGEPTPYQAVLQAGTAVLVDDTGTPRTKCSCGNPLTQAQPDNTDPATTTGDNPWNGYTTQTITIVDAGDQTDTLTLTDLDTGQPIEQPIGGGGDLESVDWRNFTYPAETCPAATGVGEPFTLVDGEVRFEDGPSGPGGYPGVFYESAAVGDLTGDGTEEVVVVLSCTGGGTGFFTHLSVWSGGSGGPELLQVITPQFTDRGYTSTAFDGNAIVIYGLLPGPNDGLCCPTVPASETWRWNGSAFVLE
jgi:hypothetical protein